MGIETHTEQEKKIKGPEINKYTWKLISHEETRNIT